jgi:uncharacterized protein (TIGR00645 family)
MSDAYRSEADPNQERKNTLIRKFEHLWENQIIFGARWLLAPAYFILVLVLIILAYKTVEEFIQLAVQLHRFDETRTTGQVLVIIDLILIMNLVLMVLFVGYVNFVSVIKFNKSEDKPRWLGSLDYSGLKIQLIGSIIAISAIKLLRVFVDMIETEHVDTTKILLMVLLHVTFVASAVALAVVNKLKVKVEVDESS